MLWSHGEAQPAPTHRGSLVMSDRGCVAPLLRHGLPSALSRALTRYPDHYDDVLDDVHERLTRLGAATKLDLAALIAWKHVRNARWMKVLLSMPTRDVEVVTRHAFREGLSDAERVARLQPLPGFGGGGAFTSVLLTAWEPASFGVFDRLVYASRHLAVTEACTCDWSHPADLLGAPPRHRP